MRLWAPCSVVTDDREQTLEKGGRKAAQRLRCTTSRCFVRASGIQPAWAGGFSISEFGKQNKAAGGGLSPPILPRSARIRVGPDPVLAKGYQPLILPCSLAISSARVHRPRFSATF